MGGGSNGTGKTMEAGGAETQYIESKTSIWWDIENCQVPKGCDPHAIAQNISSALINMNYCGRISISAYGDTNRIPMTVQHALSSTGITLNHVPAGVKDASDKKILVDMLFWAVDNPAPANYLLISGDRDFSNALHQLRMRRYNILLAQPQNASAPLLAAAKSVWLWTSLLVGGPPLESGDTPQFGSNNNMSNSDMLKSSSSETMHIDPASDSYFHGNQKFANNGRGGDNKYKGKQTRKIPTQPNMSRTVSAPAGIQEPQTSDGGVNQQGYAQGKPFKEAPHEFFRANSPRPSSNGLLSNFFPPNPDPSWNNGNYQPQYPQAPPQNNIPPQPDFSQGRQFPQNSNSQGYRPLLPRPDVLPFTTAPPVNNKQSISDYPNGIHYPPIFQQRNGGEVRPSSFTTPPSPANMNAPQYLHLSQSGPPFFHDAQNVRYAPRGPEFPTVYHDSRNTRYGHMSGPEHLPSSSPVGINSVPVWGTPGCPKPPEYTQGLIGVILLALDTLKNEKIIPTEANITDCIRYGDPKQRNTDVRTALESAIEHQMVVKHNVGTLIVHLRKNGALWKCVNFLERKNYPKPVWDGIQNFLSTPGGRSAITACQCRYEAAIALRNSCLKDYTLGDILQIVNMIITTKRWINVHPSGWKPIAIVLPIVKAEVPIVVKAEVDTISSA